MHTTNPANETGAHFSAAPYSIGVMETQVEERSQRSGNIVRLAISIVEAKLLPGIENLRIQLFHFLGPHLTPDRGAYSPLDFLQFGIVEKVDQRTPFLLIVTEVDLIATSRPYVVALPSQLTNVGIISLMRLRPKFWGEQGGEEVAAQRLASVMMHTLGHILNLPHSSDDTNVMYDFQAVEQLDRMTEVTEEQVARMRRNLPIEARNRVSQGPKWRFIGQALTANWRAIWRTIRQANPLTLIFRLPTMLAAAFSLIIVLFFAPEIWDIASTTPFYKIGLFALAALVTATFLLYRAFSLHSVHTRQGKTVEAIVVTKAATLVSLALTLAVLYLAFFVLSYLAIVAFFPDKLMETWPTVDPAVRVVDHVRLSMLLSAMAILGGSLGGKTDNREVIRHILFLDEET